MKINPHDPVYPNPGVPGIYRDCPGLPIRLELAARFMASELSSPLVGDAVYADSGERCTTMKEVRKAITGRAIAYADALIAAYNEGQE